MSYLFTIFGSLQGVMLFVMHCLFSKQVGRDPLRNKAEKSAAFADVETQFVFIVILGEGRVWKHPVQMLCTEEEELLRVQFLVLQQSSGEHLLMLV